MKQEQRGEERRKEGKLKERREEEMEETGGNKRREAQDKTRETEVQPLSVSLLSLSWPKPKQRSVTSLSPVEFKEKRRGDQMKGERRSRGEGQRKEEIKWRWQARSDREKGRWLDERDIECQTKIESKRDDGWHEVWKGKTLLDVPETVDTRLSHIILSGVCESWKASSMNYWTTRMAHVWQQFVVSQKCCLFLLNPRNKLEIKP